MFDGYQLDDPDKPFIIAEISGNHQRDYAKAVSLVHAAFCAGASAVKFQTFRPEEICADIALPFGHDPDHDAWLHTLGVTRMPELFALGGLPREWHAPLKTLAESLGLAFLSTPFSVDAARFLVEEVGVGALKIASGDLTFTPLLAYAAGTGLPVILSTGMATMEEIGAALSTFTAVTSAHTFPQVALLHCISTYPCPGNLVNLRCIATLRRAFPCGAFGFSDHTLSTDFVPAVAVACGASVLEKHFRLAEDEHGVDSAHSLDPAGFARYVSIAAMIGPDLLGNGIKAPVAAEAHDRIWSRRGSDGLRPTDAARQGVWASDTPA